MENKPLVSIIIPLYNAKYHIAETIQSALDQTWPNKEIIVVDDGSTDNSLAIALEYEQYEVIVLSQKNSGAGAARNHGLSSSKGSYIQFLDADDLLSPNKIAKQMELLLAAPKKVAVCSTVHFNDGDDPYINAPSDHEEHFLFDTDNPIDFLVRLYGGDDNQGSMVTVHAWLTPIDIIKKAGYWNEAYSLDDDGEFFCRVLLASEGVIRAKNCFSYYRKYNDVQNVSAAKTAKALYGQFQLFLSKKQHLVAASNTPRVKKALARILMELAVYSYLVDKKLYTTIMNEIGDLGGTSYVPTLGGPKIELIKKLFGWKTAKLLQHYLR